MRSTEREPHTAERMVRERRRPEAQRRARRRLSPAVAGLDRRRDPKLGVPVSAPRRDHRQPPWIGDRRLRKPAARKQDPLLRPTPALTASLSQSPLPAQQRCRQQQAIAPNRKKTFAERREKEKSEGEITEPRGRQSSRKTGGCQLPHVVPLLDGRKRPSSTFKTPPASVKQCEAVEKPDFQGRVDRPESASIISFAKPQQTKRGKPQHNERRRFRNRLEREEHRIVHAAGKSATRPLGTLS